MVLLFSIPLLVLAQPHANFSSTNHSGCSPLVTHFTNTSTGSPVSWHWVFDNSSPGDTSNLPNPLWIYNTPGSYDVKLVVTDASGHRDSMLVTHAVTVVSQPVIRFTASDTILSCPPQTITFTNHSDTGGCTPYYTWFIDSAHIHTTNASYTFTVPGYYNISLTESDSCGCAGSLSKTAYIKIDSFPSACYNTPDTMPCSAPAIVCYNNCSSAGVSYLWHFGDGGSDTAFNPCHTFMALGTYTDTLIASSLAGCTSTLTVPNHIRIAPISFGFYTDPAIVCTGVPIICHDTSLAGSHHFWRFSSAPGDTSNADVPSFTYTTAGTYTILDSTWNDMGCNGTATHSVLVKSSPNSAFTADSLYRCRPTITTNFTPVTAFSSSYTYLWRFDDSASTYNDSSALPTPSHIFSYNGSYTPSLTISDTSGCSSTTSISDYINILIPTDTVVIDATSVLSHCLPDTIHYTVRLAPSFIPFITDSVSFGDGTYDTAMSGSHIYTRPGTYFVRHYYHLPSGGCYRSSAPFSFAARIDVDSLPIVTVTNSADTICPSIPDVLSGSCTTCRTGFWSPTRAYRYLDSVISIARTGTSTGDTIARTFFNPGDNVATFTAINGSCLIHYDDTIYVHSPYCTFSASQPDCSDRHTIQFTFTSSPLPSSFKWFFGDGDSSSAVSPVHTYAADGDYGVALLDTSYFTHCYNSNTKDVNIYPFPTSVPVSDSVLCVGQEVWVPTYDFYFYSYVDYGDGFTDALGIWDYFSPYYYFYHAYTAPGLYTLTTILKNPFGCRDTITETNLIQVERPGGGLWGTPLLGCAPLTVNLHDTDLVSSGIPILARHWVWSTGDTTMGAIARDTTHIFPEGNHQIFLIDSDANACVSVDSITIRAVKPHAWFTASYTNGCIGSSIAFTDTNSHVNYRWYFGDGTPAIGGHNPHHTYTVNGVYTDTLVITTLSGGMYPVGCTDTLIRNDYINISDSSIRVGFTLSDTLASCPPFVTLATNTTYPASGNYYKWKYGHDSTTIDYTLTNAIPSYYFPGDYVITLVDSNSIGCKDSLKKMVHVGGPTGILTFTPMNVCVNGQVSFHLTNTGSAPLDSYYVWSIPPYGAFSTDTPGFVINYNTAGVYNPYVLIDSSGCQIAIHTADSVHVFSPPAITVTHPPVTCGYSVQLLASGTLTYNWIPSYGLSCDTCSNPVASPVLATLYTVVGTNIAGCRDTVTTYVVIDPPHYISFTGSARTCIGHCDSISAGPIAGVYVWSGPALSCTICRDVVVCPVATSVYTVVVTDTLGCRDTNTLKVTVEPLPVLQYNPLPAYVCKGTPSQIFAAGAAHFNWLPDTDVSCDTCASPFLSPANSLVYTVTGTSIYGCENKILVPVTVFERNPTVVSKDTTICIGDHIQLYAAGGVKYLWIPGAKMNDDTIPNPIVYPDTTQTYRVVITENVCFKEIRDVTITVAPLPVISMPASYTIIAGSQVQLNGHVSNNVKAKYTWAPADNLTCSECSSPIATPVGNTIYTVTAISSDGCVADSTIAINMYCDNSQVFIPNTFTPNKDGVNDQFYVSGRGISTIKSLKVYNRWGEVVYDRQNIPANDPNNGWDGTFKNGELAPDVFVFVVDAVCELGEIFHYQGNIALVR